MDAIPDRAFARITDLGCGSGLSTALLAARWPAADITAVDNSPAMLAKAARRVPEARLQEADIAAYASPEPQDLILANASLHWVPEHAHLLPRLLTQLAPGGVLAVQMPHNLEEPSHRLMREVAAEAPFAGFLGAAPGQRNPLLSLGDYYDLLAADCAGVRIWETRYVHALDGVDAIVEWFASTGLKPYLDGLPDDLEAVYRTRYRERLETAYAPRSGGTVLLEMPRLFLIGERR